VEKARDDSIRDGSINVSRLGALLLIEIDRAPKRNGFTPEMIAEYSAAISAYEADETAYCALLHAAGEHFTAGLDLARATQVWDRGESLYPAHLHDMFDLREPRRRKPLVIAVQGICFTVGVELMLTADIVVAAQDCRFAVSEVTRGIMACGGATIRLSGRAGWGNAMRWLLTGDEFDTPTAWRMGIVQEVTAPGAHFEKALEIADRIATRAAPLAVLETRANAQRALAQGEAAAAAQFDSVRAKLRLTADAKEGVASFREKRPAKFTGK